MDLVVNLAATCLIFAQKKRKKGRNHLQRLREPINHAQKKKGGIIASHGPIKLVAFVFVMEAR